MISHLAIMTLSQMNDVMLSRSWQKEAYLLRLTGLEGVFEDFHSS